MTRSSRATTLVALIIRVPRGTIESYIDMYIYRELVVTPVDSDIHVTPCCNNRFRPKGSKWF